MDKKTKKKEKRLAVNIPCEMHNQLKYIGIKMDPLSL